MKNKMLIEKVENILQKVPSTREDDQKLYVAYVETYYNVEFSKEVFMHNKILGIPGFKTIERCRRTIQNKLKKYKPSDEVEAERREAEKEYRNFNGGINK